MKIWRVVLFLAMQFLAVRLVLAQDVKTSEPASPPAAVTPVSQAVDAKPALVASADPSLVAPAGQSLIAPADPCKETLPQLENDYASLVTNVRNDKQSVSDNREEYVRSFQQMTQALVDLSQKKEDELQKIIENRQALQQAMQKFAEDNNNETSKNLQDSYLNLTVQIYSQAMEGPKTIEALKAQLVEVEAARGQYENSQKSQADLDQKKLDLEGKIASLKIRCTK